MCLCSPRENIKYTFVKGIGPQLKLTSNFFHHNQIDFTRGTYVKQIYETFFQWDTYIQLMHWKLLDHHDLCCASKKEINILFPYWKIINKFLTRNQEVLFVSNTAIYYNYLKLQNEALKLCVTQIVNKINKYFGCLVLR